MLETQANHAFYEGHELFGVFQVNLPRDYVETAVLGEPSKALVRERRRHASHASKVADHFTLVLEQSRYSLANRCAEDTAACERLCVCGSDHLQHGSLQRAQLAVQAVQVYPII